MRYCSYYYLYFSILAMKTAVYIFLNGIKFKRKCTEKQYLRRILAVPRNLLAFFKVGKFATSWKSFKFYENIWKRAVYIIPERQLIPRLS